MSTQFQKLSNLLKELFQSDQADLDFGIYRVINQRREEINKFLDEDLLPQVKEAFAQYESADTKQLEEELKETITDAHKLGVEDPDTLPAVKKLRERLATYGVDVADLENQVYSALYNFFRRYYDNGDFISQRRYKEGVYAIPYEGEEVKLHWANNDQYYIKTSENFRDYSFKLPSGKHGHFVLVEAESEKDNRKEITNDMRRFVLAEEPLEWQNDEVVLRFEFRQETTKQSACNEQTIEQVFSLREKLSEQTQKDALAELATPAQTEGNSNYTFLEKHLEDYTRRNTQDYFIHKDLGKFLRRELDFFIKNEIMHLDNIEHESIPRVEQYLSKIKVIRQIAHKIIDFLAQIENFQKKLLLKKKFVVENHYCITLDRVPEELYEEIASNDVQRREWISLFAIDEIEGYSEPLNIEFLKSNSNLLIDTKFFDRDFKYRLLSIFKDLDNELNGVLVYSENFQGLNILNQKYREKIHCIHIDPPYNTDTSGFIYKNNYRHSSWLAMMADRLNLANEFLKNQGVIFCHIDDNEHERLSALFSQIFYLNQGTIVWDKRNPAPGASTIARQHEYLIVYSKGKTKLQYLKENAEKILNKASALITKHMGVNADSRKAFKQWIKKQKEFTGGEKAYSLIDDDGRVYQSVHLGASEQRDDKKYFRPLIHPITGEPCPVPSRGWTGDPEFLDDLLEKDEIIFGEDHTTQPRRKYFLDENMAGELTTVVQFAGKGKTALDALGLSFPYSHPVGFYSKLNWSGTQDDKAILLDFFAGSGTNGHSIINLNREDGGNRKYILIEMGEAFTKTLKPRIQKTIYSESWRNGKPLSRVGSSHTFKYMKLESFEDTLNNLILRQLEGAQATFLDHQAFGEDYMLHYMLDFESQDSLLDLSRFETPFEYQLQIATNTVGETESTSVDLLETFNYLLGLHVQNIYKIDNTVVVRGNTRDEKQILVIWRTVPEMDNDQLDAFFTEQIAGELEGVTDIYINGDNNLANIRPANQHWTVHLTEETFHRLMFEE